MPRDEINLAELTQEALRAQRQHVRDLVASRNPRGRRFGTEEMATPEQIDSAQRALAGLVKEARSIVKDGARWGKTRTVEEKRAIIADWFTDLPPEQQRLLLQELTRIHNDERKAS